MNPRERASLEFQAPHSPTGYRPQRVTPRWVCPQCQRETNRYLVSCDGHSFETDRCEHHGDVIAVLRHFPLETHP